VRAWVGTSGWVYGDWRGRFYPSGVADRDRLDFYAHRFATVELNASFYRLPDAARFADWRARTPAGFVFAVKMSRYVTHIRRLEGAADGIDRFFAAASGLGDKLGPVLVQLPPTLPVDLDALDAFLGAWPPAARAAFEFRHRSWDADEVRVRLRDAGASIVLADRPGARVAPDVTADWSYVRFHQGRRAAAGYPRPKLRRWADRLSAMPVDELFVYFNNDPGAAAPRDAATLITLLDERGVAVHAIQPSLP
jgi:uncharacterized protein YecE (DUF72 family)